MNRAQVWILGARPKTLALSIAPVLIGTTLSLSQGVFNPLTFLFTLLTALGIQIGTNLANDYFDFIKGADTAERKGPLRLSQSGLVSAQAVKFAMILVFSLTFLTGCSLIWHGGPAIAFLLSLSILLGVIYTGGPYPLAYLGLGDLFVLVFFGPVAVAGTFYLQTHHFSLEALIIGIGPGALSTAVLVVNNLRDIEEDRKANKKTLPARFGKTFGQIEYLLMIHLALLPPIFLSPSHPLCLLALLTLIPAIPLMKAIMNNKEPAKFNEILARTGQLTALYSVLFCLGWLW